MSDEDFISTGPALDPDERDPEAPPADALDQATPALPGREPPPVRLGLAGERSGLAEVNEWDAVEQSRVVDLDEEY